jgi:hypothetical protein
MRGIGQSAIVLAAGLAIVGGVSILLPTQASAQFPSIDGILRGAMQHNCCYGPGYRAPSHRSSSKSHDDKDSSSSSPAKEKDATQDESPSANGGTRQPQTAGSQNISRSQTSDAAPGGAGSGHGNDDQPSFAPSR